MRLLEPDPFSRQREVLGLQQHSHPLISNTLSEASRLFSQAKRVSSLRKTFIPTVKMIHIFPYYTERCHTIQFSVTCHYQNTFYALGTTLSPQTYKFSESLSQLTLLEKLRLGADSLSRATQISLMLRTSLLTNK